MKDITTEYSPLGEPTAIALGVFDGVHLGHRLVIDTAVKKSGGEVRSAVFTFKSDTVMNKGSERLLTNSEKLRRLSQRRIDYVCCPDFGEYRDMPYEDFVKEVLVGRLGCRYAVCGRDFRFGRGAQGDDSAVIDV